MLLWIKSEHIKVAVRDDVALEDKQSWLISSFHFLMLWESENPPTICYGLPREDREGMSGILVFVFLPGYTQSVGKISCFKSFYGPSNSQDGTLMRHLYHLIDWEFLCVCLCVCVCVCACVRVCACMCVCVWAPYEDSTALYSLIGCGLHRRRKSPVSDGFVVILSIRRQLLAFLLFYSPCEVSCLLSTDHPFFCQNPLKAF